jgi:hypothetical protein
VNILYMPQIAIISQKVDLIASRQSVLAGPIVEISHTRSLSRGYLDSDTQSLNLMTVTAESNDSNR